MTHHCELYSRVRWPALAIQKRSHWFTFIDKAMLGLLPTYICFLLSQRRSDSCSLRSQDHVLLSIPFARTELGKKAFVHSAPYAWNMLQKELISLNAFKSKLRGLEADSTTCTCFS
ncbi:hypothetical protein NQD34_002532 [Periophthalmus magnuspinnatus]|nr:hypothetical protein NQD34_002532 [Periophthalmus magnuspinnatus]